MHAGARSRACTCAPDRVLLFSPPALTSAAYSCLRCAEVPAAEGLRTLSHERQPPAVARQRRAGRRNGSGDARRIPPRRRRARARLLQLTRCRYQRHFLRLCAAVGVMQRCPRICCTGGGCRCVGRCCCRRSGSGGGARLGPHRRALCRCALHRRDLAELRHAASARSRLARARSRSVCSRSGHLRGCLAVSGAACRRAGGTAPS